MPRDQRLDHRDRHHLNMTETDSYWKETLAAATMDLRGTGVLLLLVLFVLALI